MQNIKKMEARARRHEGRLPASDLPLRRGGRGLHPPRVTPCLQRAHPCQQPGWSTGFKRNPCGCRSSPPYPTACRSGREGCPLPATLQKTMPYASTRLFGSHAGGSGAVPGTSHWPGHPDFIAKGCRLAVARFISPADAAVAASGVGEPLHTSPDPLAHAGRWKSRVLQQGRAHRARGPDPSVSLSRDHHFFLETKRWQK